MATKTKAEREQEKLEEAELVRRMRAKGQRPIDPEVEEALGTYRVERERESRASQAPEPAPDPSPCPKHPSWNPPRRLGQPRPPSSLCPECIKHFDAMRTQKREYVEVDPHPTTRAMDVAWRKHQERLNASDLEPERSTPAWDRWWLREQKRRRGLLSSDADTTAQEVEADAIREIDAKREKDEYEKKRRPGGATVVFASPWAGGHESPSSRTLYRRRVVRDSGITVSS